MASRFRLSNGLTVVFEPQHAAKVAAFQIWLKVGSADEAPDEVGLAHLHEHMLFKGTARRGLGEIARSIEAHGGEINAWTSFEQTVYHVVLASRFAREGLDVLADAVRASTFDAAELAREIEVVCEEIKRSTDMPSRRASRDLFATVYTQHPYGRPVIGFEENVRAHTRDHVLRFYRRHYTPSNMVLAAAGDFTEEQLREWVEALLGGSWGEPPTPRPARAVEPRLEDVRVVLKPDDVEESWLNLAFHIPSVDHPDAPALDVLAMVAGQGDASRLSLEVRRKRTLANDVHAYAYTPKDSGIFALSLTAPVATLDEAFLQSARVLAQLRTTVVDKQELDTVKALIESEAIYQRETVQGLSRKLGYYESSVGGIEREARYYEAIAQVTPEKVLEVAQRYLTFDRAVVTGLLSAGASLDTQRVKAILEQVHRESPEAPAPRKLPPSAHSPIRLASSTRKAKSELVFEKLPSGAQIIVREERAVPLFAMRAAFHGGVRYETQDTNGVGTLLSRTLTRGTKSLGAEEISHLIDSLAGSVSAMAGRSSVSARGEFLSKHFDRGFELFAEVLNEPTFPEAELSRERHHLLEDIAARDDRPATLAFELFAKTLYLKHPYRFSLLGERSSVESLSQASLSAVHAHHMDPSQLTLAVVGDVDAELVLQKARAAFGASRGKAAAPPVMPHEPEWSGPRQTKRELKRAQTHLVWGFEGAKVTDPWRRSLEVLSTLLSGQSGRLFLELRDKRSLAYSVSSMTVEGIDPGYFAVYIGTSPEKVDQALSSMREQLERVRDQGVSAAELERAREHLIGTHEIGLQRNGARAAVMALDHCYGIGADRFLHYADEVGSVTGDDVRAVAQRVINFENSALAVVGP